MTPYPRRAGERGGVFLKVVVAVTVFLALAALYLLRGPILRQAAAFLVAEDAPQPADAIVVLGDDTFQGDRAAKAAELYQQRWAPRVVASGRYLRSYASIADLMRRDLVERGVPQKAVIHFPHMAGSTREEAFRLRELIREKHWRHVIVVTSNYHTGRARYIFRGVLGSSVDVYMVSAPDSSFDPERWWQSREGVKTFVRETQAWVLAIWERARGERREETAQEPATAPTR